MGRRGLGQKPLDFDHLGPALMRPIRSNPIADPLPGFVQRLEDDALLFTRPESGQQIPTLVIGHIPAEAGQYRKDNPVRQTNTSLLAAVRRGDLALPKLQFQSFISPSVAPSADGI